jgi:hypothetical protein
MGEDEATGEKLTAQRGAWESIHAGGAKIFVANYGDFHTLTGGLLDLPVLLNPVLTELDKLSLMPAAEFLSYPDALQQALTKNALFEPDRQAMIAQTHDSGRRVYTYMDLLAGYTLPDAQRRMRGLHLAKAGIDGTMTWSYAHISDRPHSAEGELHWSPIFSFVLRGKDAPIDTLSWEAYREAADDARYLATLEGAVRQAEASGKHSDLVKETRKWVAEVSPDVPLDAWRGEMIRRTEKLAN